MTSELQKKLIEWLDNLANFTSTEIPPFISEVASYGFYSNLWKSFLLLTCVVLLFAFMRSIYKEVKDDDVGGAVFIFGIAFVFLVICLFGLSDFACETMKALFAPKLFVIDYLRK